MSETEEEPPQDLEETLQELAVIFWRMDERLGALEDQVADLQRRLEALERRPPTR